MRNKNSIVPLGIIGIIIVAFSVVAFILLDVETTTVNKWALAFLLLSEFVLFGGLIGLRFTGTELSKAFLRVGVSTVLLLYFIATLVSMLFAGAFQENLNTFILMELALIVLFSIISIAIIAWSRKIARSNEADMAKVGTNEPKRGGI